MGGNKGKQTLADFVHVAAFITCFVRHPEKQN